LLSALRSNAKMCRCRAPRIPQPRPETPVPLLTPLSPDANEEVAELARFFNETLGFCPNSVLTMQRRPNIAKAFITLNKAVMENHGRVTSGLKRLIGYVASHAAGCPLLPGAHHSRRPALR
jgi:hypothetical protein